MRKGDSKTVNRMFRARIYAQAFTLVAVVAGGIYYKDERQQRRELNQMIEARKKQEKRDAWLRELEIRDQEDREWRERHAAIERAAKEAGKRQNSSAGTTATTPSRSTEADTAPDPHDSSEKNDGSVLDSVKALVAGGKK